MPIEGVFWAALIVLYIAVGLLMLRRMRGY